MKKLFCLVLCLSFFLCGCMEARELKDRTIIEAVGIDKEGEGYALIFQQYQPKAAQNPGEASGKSKPVKSSGQTISEALDKVTHHNGNEVFLGNSTYIVIGKDIAKEGVLQELQYFNGEGELSPSVALVIADGKASDLISAQAESSEGGGSAIRDILEQGEKNGLIGRCTMEDCIQRLMGGGASPFLPVISVQGEGENSSFKVSAMAVFDGEQLLGSLPIDAAKGILWANDQMERALLTVENRELGRISAEIQRSKTKVEVSLPGGFPQFHLSIRCTAQLMERISHSGKATVSQQELEQVETLLEEEIRRLTASAIQTCFTDNLCDSFRFYDHLKQQQPLYWQQVKDRWKELMEDCSFLIEVHCEISKSGQLATTSQ